jgi:peroxiredoxin
VKSIRWITVLAVALLRQATFAGDEAQTTLVKVGDNAPDFVCQTLSGNEFSLSKQKGKVVLVNFFATWCGPCKAELPHLEKEIFRKFGDQKDFALIVIGREHTTQDLEKFEKDKGFSLPMAADSKRAIYGKYATQYIPRNFVIGKDGKIKWASTGYSEADFQKMVRAIKNELKEP